MKTTEQRRPCPPFCVSKFAESETQANLSRTSETQSDDAKDAARYRWLRDPSTDVGLVIDKRTGYVEPLGGVPGVGGYPTYEYRAGEELDAAIDAAIDALKGGE